MIRLLAALAVTAAVAATAPPAARHTVPPRPPVTVGVEIISGTPQREHAYAAYDVSKYITDYSRPLVVRITGVNDATSTQRRVQFTCVSKDCGLGDPEQPEGGDRKGPDNYSILTKAGKASLHASITHTEPFGTFTVYAQAVAKTGERSVRSAPFTLTTY